MSMRLGAKKSLAIKSLMANFQNGQDQDDAHFDVPPSDDPVDKAIEEANRKLLLMAETCGDSVFLHEDSNYVESVEENICSRKSSYSSLHNGQAGTLNQQQQQNRRCSQNSNGASSSSNIYAASQQNGHGSNVPQPPPVPVQMNGGQRNGLGVPPAPPPPPNGIASVSTKAPPPPPPPPADFKVAGSNKGTSFADQLKAQQLRKTSGPPSVNGSGTGAGGGNKSNGSDTPSAPQQKQRGGAAELFSELAAKIESRNTTKSCKADTVSTSSSSGVSASDGSDSGATLINNSILGRKLGPNGDASTIRAWNKPNGIVTAGITAAAAQSNGIDSPKVQRKLTEPLSPTITATDLIQFKQEILTEVKQEIAKAKQEILEAIRIQLSR